MPPELSAVGCAHCQEPVPAGRVVAGGSSFCCSGCETVAGLLHRHGLTGYYRLGERPHTADPTGRTYAELDAAEFLSANAQALPNGALAVDLYLEGVHCRACVWLVEKLPSVLPGVQEARLDLGRSLARVVWRPEQVALSQVARTLDGLGYRPHPFRGAERLERRRVEDRRLLTQIAWAGALAANVMLLSFALYAGEVSGGMEGRFAALFRWLAFGLTGVAVLGPGRTFLAGAWAAIRTRTPHIDLPLGLALTAGLASGAWNTIAGAGAIYFDTLAVLVFLLLVGRYLQHGRRRAATDATELLASLAPSSARRLTPSGAVEEVPIDVLEAGAQVEVRAGDPFPVDGSIVAGSSHVDTSLLTGESWPRPVGVGDRVHAGTVNATSRLVVDVEQAGGATRIAALMKQVEDQQRRKAPVVLLADRIAGTFVTAVVILAALTLALWSVLDPSRAVDHAIALLIVTCPCALALATPLAVSAALGRAAQHGVLVRGGDVLQRLSGNGGRLWLDKTGTLTEGRATLRAWSGDEAVRPLVLALEQGSAHPIARAFEQAWSDVTSVPKPERPPERVAAGLTGRVSGHQLHLGSPASVEALGVSIPDWARAALDDALTRALTPVVVVVDGAARGVAAFGDRLRPEAQAVLARLRSRGWRPGILSGDHPHVVAAVGRELGIDPVDCRGGQTPEQKLAQVEADLRAGQVVMVGDGVNDAAALATATVGVGVQGGSATTLEAADVFMSRGGLSALGGLLETAQAARRTIGRTFAVSLSYNLVAASLAIGGVITPLLAAVLMPISSLTVIALAYRGASGVAWPEEVRSWT